MAYSTIHKFEVMADNQQVADVLNGTAEIVWEEREYTFDRAISRTEARKLIARFEGAVIKTKGQRARKVLGDEAQ